MQLARAASSILIAALSTPAVAFADDRADFSTTWYVERRRGEQGGLSVLHPQAELEVDAGDHASLGVGYSADVVSGATAAVFTPDATSSATRFDDTRHEGSLSLGFRGARSALVLSGGAGVERDYTSIIASAAGNVDLPGKNTNLALSYTHNFDHVCDKENQMATALERRALTGVDPCATSAVVLVEDTDGETVWRDLDIDTVQAALTQNVTPTLVTQASLYGQVLRGFQANPYRRVRVAGVEPQESLPEVRGRLALMLQANKFLESVRSTVHGSVRGYSDTWGVNSVALEMAYSQYMGDSLLVRVRGRIYQQSEATFFKDAFFYDTTGPAGTYFTGDRELAPIRNVITGARLSYIGVNEDGSNVWGLFDEIQLDLKGDLLFLMELPANPLDQNPMGIDQQFLSSGQMLDAFVLQLSLQTRF